MEIWSKQTSDCAKSVGWEDWDRIVLWKLRPDLILLLLKTQGTLALLALVNLITVLFHANDRQINQSKAIFCQKRFEQSDWLVAGLMRVTHSQFSQ